MSLRTQGEMRAMVAREALSWMGTAYHHHGRIKGVGVDCAQLLCGVFEACGMVSHVELGTYPIDWHMHHNEELFSDWMDRYAFRRNPGSPWEVGDVVVWRFGRTFSHGSIYVGDGLLVHSYIGRGVMLSRTEEEPLAARAFRHWSFWE